MVEKILSREDVLDRYEHFLTVGGIKKFIEDYAIPDTAKVVVQRVEDYYYQKGGWGVYLKDGMYSQKDDPESMNQYTPAWCCVRYKDDPDILFIDLHY